MNATHIQQIIKEYIDAYNSMDVKRMLQHLHPDIVFVNISNGEINMKLQGLDEVREQAEKAKAIFSSREQQIKKMTIIKDTIEVNIDYKGTLATDLPNGLKKGEVLTLQGKSIFTFHHDKIIELTDIS